MTQARNIDSVVRTERAERFDLDVPGRIETLASRATVATIVNLSRSGCLVRTDARTAIGDWVTLSLRAVGARQAIVVRHTHDGFACSFSSPLREAELASVLATAAASETKASAAVRTLRQNITPPPDKAPGILHRLLRRP